jgi:hypothetical protein
VKRPQRDAFFSGLKSLKRPSNLEMLEKGGSARSACIRHRIHLCATDVTGALSIIGRQLWLPATQSDRHW